MKLLITIPIVILFFAVSTFGNFIVGYCPPPKCIEIMEPEDCGATGCGSVESEPSPCGETSAESSGCERVQQSSGCGGPTPKPVPIQQCSSPEKSQPVPVKAKCVLPIVLAFDPSTIPCCAKVCTTHSLSDFREGPKSNSPSPDMIANDYHDLVAACLEYEIPTYLSRPTGVHPIISTTVLRL